MRMLKVQSLYVAPISNSEINSVWLEGLLWEQKVEGSNPPSRTNFNKKIAQVVRVVNMHGGQSVWTLLIFEDSYNKVLRLNVHSDV